MDLDTWVSLGTLVALAIGLFTYLNAKFDRIDQRFDQLRAELKEDIRILDARVYALATGLRIDIARAQEPDAG